MKFKKKTEKKPSYLFVIFCFREQVPRKTMTTMMIKPTQPPTIAMMFMSLVFVSSRLDIVQEDEESRSLDLEPKQIYISL